jgi:hypothetical protein
MKFAICTAFAALILVTTLAGCGSIKQEGAMEWLQKQPMRTDP